MMENPVRSPMVPPIADNISSNFAALSLVILSKVGVSKKILTGRSLFSQIESAKLISVFSGQTGWVFSTYSKLPKKY